MNRSPEPAFRGASHDLLLSRLLSFLRLHPLHPQQTRTKVGPLRLIQVSSEEVIEMSTKCSESTLQKFERCLHRELRDGLEHGFFDMEVSCELIKGRKRRLTIRAGKCHQFVISQEELQS